MKNCQPFLFIPPLIFVYHLIFIQVGISITEYRETTNNHLPYRIGMSVGYLVGCHMNVEKPILDLFCFHSLNKRERDVSSIPPDNGKFTCLF